MIPTTEIELNEINESSPKKDGKASIAKKKAEKAFSKGF